MVATAGNETVHLIEAYCQSRNIQIRDQLVINYVPLVRRLCGRFRRSRESQEDLVQVGVIGLINAVDKFDPDHGASLPSLAIPEILGAVLNYLRDHSNPIKPPRTVRRNKLIVDRVAESLAPRLGRWPTVAEITGASKLPKEDVYEAMKFGRTADPRSLDETIGLDEGDGRNTLAECLGSEDPQFEQLVNRLTMAQALNTLPFRERTILTLRFYEGLSQRLIAERIHISQMHVSRLERAALQKLRRYMEGGPATLHPALSKPRSPATELPVAS